MLNNTTCNEDYFLICSGTVEAAIQRAHAGAQRQIPSTIKQHIYESCVRGSERGMGLDAALTLIHGGWLDFHPSIAW